MLNGIHPFASFASPSPSPRVLGGAGAGGGRIVFRSDSTDPAMLLALTAARPLVLVIICRSADAMMLALVGGPIRLILVDAGTPAEGLLDPAESILPLLASPQRCVPRFLLSHDPEGGSASRMQSAGWFGGVAKGPLDRSTIPSLMEHRVVDH